MIITIIVSLAVLSLILLLLLVRDKRAIEHDALRTWNSRNCKVSIDAFRHLVSPQEAAYLRLKLPHGEFRSVQRKRISLAWKCVRMIGRNAKLLIRVADQARCSKENETAEEGRRLLNLALQLRINVFLVETLLIVRWFVPEFTLKMPISFEKYELALGKVDLLEWRTRVNSLGRQTLL